MHVRSWCDGVVGGFGGASALLKVVWDDGAPLIIPPFPANLLHLSLSPSAAALSTVSVCPRGDAHSSHILAVKVPVKTGDDTCSEGTHYTCSCTAAEESSRSSELACVCVCVYAHAAN